MNACKTRARKVELQKKYAEKNWEVKKSVRRDQRNWTDNLSLPGRRSSQQRKPERIICHYKSFVKETDTEKPNN